MSTEIIVNNDIIEINVTEEPIIIEAPSGAYPLPTGVYSVYGRTGNVVAQEGDYTLTLLGDVAIVTPSTGQVLRYNGTAWVNSTESYVGTVTSVAASVPTGLTITGSPITTSGTLAFGLQTGYSIPTTASQTTWDTAYNRSLTSAAVTGTTTKTLTLNQQSGGTITASWTDDNTDAVTSVFGRTGAVVAVNGDYSTSLVTEGTNLYYTDVRARASNSFVAGSGAYNSTTGVITIPTNNNQITNGAAYITLTSLSASSPLSYSNTTGAFSISQANTSTNGYLSSFDWNTFNSKQTALTLGNLTSSDITVTGGTGAVVGSGATMTLATVNTNVGAYGDSTHVPTITVNGKGLVTAASQTAIPTASSSVTGLLTSANWSTFNDKQNQLNGTGFVKASGTTITYDNSTYLTTIEGIAAGGELSGTYASPSLVNSAVTGKVLTGVNITGGTIVSTDSILTAFGKVQNQINGLIGGSLYKGTWNANTNNPALASGVGTSGWYYIVSVAGTTNLDGITDWQVGDWAIFQGSVWQKVDNTDAVVSVNGFTGAVSLTTSNITEGTNLYYTDARARLSNSAGTGISYNSTTGVITNSAPDQTVSLTGAGTTSISGTYPSFTITSNDTYNGTVTSIGITESVAALSITGSPVTTSGNINIGFAGTSSQYVGGDGSLITFPSIISQASNLVTEVYNETGATLTKGTIVYINGGHGNLPTVAKALATADSTSAQTYGFINADLTNNNNGFVTVIGSLENMDTQAYANGTQLYLSGTTAGTYTSTKPQAPIHLVYVAVVVRSHPTQGVLEVRIQNGYELDELHDVQITSVANNNILQYNAATSLWKNVAGTTTNIAEGTNLYYTDTRARASLSFVAGSGAYNSTTGVITIPTNNTQITNGSNYITLASLSATSPLSYNNTTGAFIIAQATTSTNGYLSSTDWNTFNGKQSTLTFSSPLVNTAGTVSIPAATTSVNGYLTSTDWTTFNNKQAALTNPVTGTGTTNYLSKFTGTSTIGNSLIWDNGTNVGIGNTNTSYTLDVSGTGRFTSTLLVSGAATFGTAIAITGTSELIRLTPTGVDNYIAFRNSSGTQIGDIGYDGRDTGCLSIWNNNSTGNLVFGAGGARAMTITSAGNVGIGTSSPSGALQVAGDIYLGTYHTTNKLAIGADTNQYLRYNTGLDGVELSGYSGLMFSTLGGTERMRITSAGNVGIGTSSPTSNANYRYLTIMGASTSNGGVVDLRTSDSGVNMQMYVDNITGGNINVTTAHPLVFDTNGTERMRITSGGNVNIGTTAANSIYKLYVQSDTTTTASWAQVLTNGTNNLFLVRGNGQIITGDGAASPYNNTIANVANLYVASDGTLSRSTASSQRFKENINEWNGNGLDTILSLKPKTFTYKESYYKHPERVMLGLIAEEVAEVSEYLADFENEDGTGQVENVRYATIVVPLIKAIQEQNQIIQELNERLNKAGL